MSTLIPRGPYTKEELDRLYPAGLQLQLVQIILRHGERSPVSARFQNAGLTPFWPYCAAAKRVVSTVLSADGDMVWDDLTWRRRLEKFGADDNPIIAAGPNGKLDAICDLGELTDKGRQSTLSLGRRLRHLYVDQLGFMPKTIADADMIYLRATPIPRALESLQQSFWGFYPPSTRLPGFPEPTIITRTPADETLFPNDGACRRFSQLSRAFAERAAERWDDTKEMGYLNDLISKWMPPYSKRVRVDSHPSLSGIMDTINSSLAHGPETRLPKEFYDPKAREIIDRIGTEEWFEGYKESNEYRTLGIGSLLGDMVTRMVGSVEGTGRDGMHEIGGKGEQTAKGRGGERKIKFAMSGAHDTTLAGILASLGAFEGENGRWPPYTSHIAMELFRKPSQPIQSTSVVTDSYDKETPGLFYSLLGKISSLGAANINKDKSIARRPSSELNEKEKQRLSGYYVRLRYNDRPVIVEGCRAQGNHLEGDESFCTLEAFKAIVDKFTPKNWKEACRSNLNGPTILTEPQRPGL